MASQISCKVLLALVICVAVGLEGISSASTSQGEYTYATFVNADKHNCGNGGESSFRPVVNEETGCYERPQELHHSHFCLKPLPNCLQVKVYPLRSCGGRPSATYLPSSRHSEPFTFKSFKVIEIDYCPLPLGRKQWFQLREIQENVPQFPTFD